MPKLVSCLCLALVLGAAASALGATPDEFKVKREAVFEFAEKPKLTRRGDRVTISFETRGYCDVTVAVENAEGRIVRHLASGVLGENAPPPFKRNSKKQTLGWDGKDDGGRYLDNKEALTVRVSLGLEPRFERTLFWFPRRRASRYPPLMAAAPEGMYVFDGGNGIDHLRLYGHDGEYLRTVYPFPAAKVAKVEGLHRHKFPQDGSVLPLKPNFLQTSMLTSGTNAYRLMTYKPKLKAYRSVVGASGNAHYGMEGGAGAAMAVAGGRIALAHIFLNRLGTDGTSGGLPLTGPRVCMQFKNSGALGRGIMINVSPRSAALSPDGKTLYLTGYVFAGAIGKASADIVTHAGWDAFHVVMKLDVEKNDPPVAFVGSATRGKFGSGPGDLKVPTSVACDAKGRVYVSDYLNDRVQVFAPDGKLVKSIRTPRPARVAVHRRTGEIYAFSWQVMTYFSGSRKQKKAPAALTRFSALPAAKRMSECSLRVQGIPQQFNARYGTTFMEYFAELDSWAEKPTVWMVQEWAMSNVLTRKRENTSNIVMLRFDGNRLVVKRSFARDLTRGGVKAKLHECHRQRLCVNPRNGKLYLVEGDAFVGKSFKQAYVIDPATGKHKVVQLPFDAEDMCFDPDGRAYLKSLSVVGRYDSRNWREIPWDYGEQRASVHTSSSSDRRVAKLVSALALPAGGGWHHGGMYVSTKGNLVVGCKYDFSPAVRKSKDTRSAAGGRYEPPIFPGRAIGGRGGGIFLHVWDRHGKVVRRDLAPGLADNTYGLGLDAENNVYMLAAATRVLGGKRHFNDMTGTLMKFKPGKLRILTASGKVPIKLPEGSRPKRPVDIRNAAQGGSWVQGADWMYGGVGWMGKNLGIGCACFNCRFAFDYFNRSFAPEMDRYSVAVLDSAGNLILRLGRYGNVDDGQPLNPKSGPSKTRSIGGDEVALFHGAYVATHTDRRLFVADPGNGRVLSVKLGYHATEKTNLKDVPDEAKNR